MLEGLWKTHNFEEVHDKYVMIWAVQSSLYRHKSLRKEDSGTGYGQKADWKQSKMTWR